MINNPLNKFKSPGVYVMEKDISYTVPEGGYFCSKCYFHKPDIMYNEKSYCHLCNCDTGLLNKSEVNIIKRNEKIENLLENEN